MIWASRWSRAAILAALMVAACAETRPPEPAPEAPAPAETAQGGRSRATSGTRPRPPEPRAAAVSEPVPEPAPSPPALPAAEAPPPAPEPAGPPAAPEPAPRPAAASAPAGWRVRSDGTIGCADPAALRMVRGGDSTSPRLLAQARAAGGCVTTFRINEWALVAEEDDLVRLRLIDGRGRTGTLYFFRSDLVAAGLD